MSFITKKRWLGGGLIIALLTAVMVFLYSHRYDRPMLYYYGASPEVPGGKAIAIRNPLRSRRDERNAEWLIGNFRTEHCGQTVRDMLFQADPSNICPVMRNNSKASLIWSERQNYKGMLFGKLIYDLPDQRARLVVYFRTEEMGYIPSTAEVIR